MADETKQGLEGVLKYTLEAGTSSVSGGSTLGYVTGFDYSWDQAVRPIHNGATFAFYKNGRGMGKATGKCLYVNYNDVEAFQTAQSDMTVPQVYWELQINGVDGTGESVIALANGGLESVSFSQPEVEDDTLDMAFTFCTKPEELTYANRRIT